MSDLNYFRADWIEKSDKTVKVDLCIYGGTSAGVIAGIEGVRRGLSVIVLNPAKNIGGLTTGGLGETDHGRKHVIGGLSRQFYRECGKLYGIEEEFKFEPHIASAAYAAMLREHPVDIRACQFLDKVESTGGKITAVTMLGGLRAEAKMFIDATYEGDLLAKAGISYHVGREANSVYGETFNGIQVKKSHQFSHSVDPFLKEGDSSSGLLPWIVTDDLSKHIGEGDKRVQAYCFRMCMTNDPALRVAWEKPKNYDPAQYVIAGRWFRGEKDTYNDMIGEKNEIAPKKFDYFPHKTAGGFYKTDTNNHGPASSDFIGANHDWPNAGYEAREKIFQAHVTYQKGYYWFMANDEGIPQRYRDHYSKWGLPKDEFKTTANWPHALYVREARRMVSDYVISEQDCIGKRGVAEDSIGMGSYGMDSHNCSRFVTTDANGKPCVKNDGDVQEHGFPPYAIPYRALVPKRSQCTNLIVPICVSSSHIAYGSARMEPVFMVLGQSAAAAADLAIKANGAVQDVDVKKLRSQLLDEGQVLNATA